MPAEAKLDLGDYELLDSGAGRKLERFGPVLLDRPAPQAIWSPALPTAEWRRASARYERSSSGGGAWEEPNRLPESWSISIGGLKLLLRGTGFGHLGVFPEQLCMWPWIRAHAARGTSVLNLFGYTGGSSLAAAQGGAEVTHCDASRGIVQWAQENQQLCGLGEQGIRWLVDDARKFCARELRRERSYHGIVLDPPSFGRGKKGEVFKLERDLPALLVDCAKLLDRDARFFLLSAHTPGVGALALRELLREALGKREGIFASGELWIPSELRVLPSGSWASWQREMPVPPGAPS